MKMVPLWEVAHLGSGGTPRRSEPSYFGGSIPWLSIADLNDSYVDHANESLTDAGLKNSSAKIVPAGTLFIAMYGSIGKLGIASRELCTSQAIAFAIPDQSKIDTRYLYHFLLSQRSQLEYKGRGGTQKNISQEDLKKWPVPLPLLDEQRQIAAILDKADAIRQKRHQAIAHLDTLARASFLDMFATVQDTAVVEDLAAAGSRPIRTGPFGSQLLHEEFTPEGVPVLGIDNVVENKFMWKKERYISESKFQQLEKYEVFPGDVLITIMGTTGRCAVVPAGTPRSINTKHICAITPDREKILPEFLQAALLHHPGTRRFLKDNTRGAIMAGLNMGIIKKTPMPVASMSGQRTFVKRAKKIDTIKAQLLNGPETDLFESLQSRAFRGEL